MKDAITFPVGSSERFIRTKTEAARLLSEAGDDRREEAERMLADVAVGLDDESRARIAAAMESLRPSEYELPVGAPLLGEFVEATITIQVRTGYVAGEIERRILSDAVVSIFGSGDFRSGRIVGESGRTFGLALWDLLRDELDVQVGLLVKPGG